MAINTETTHANVAKDCETWPAAARARWLALFDPGDPAATRRWARMKRSAWARQTQHQRASVYSWYLASVRRRGLDERVTPDGVLAFLEDAESRCRAVTLAGYVKDLKAVAELLEPDQPDEFDWLAEVRKDLQADADRAPKRKTANLMRFTAQDLYRTGAELVREALESPAVTWTETQKMRDGLCIMLGVMCPERPRAWTNLTVGAVDLDSRSVTFPPEDVKTRAPSTRPLPPLEAALCEVWLNRYRARYAPGHDRFWIARGGAAPAAATIAAAVKVATQARLGVAVSPQRFRDAVATYIVETMPERATLASVVLRHASAAMTRNYTHTAKQLIASLKSQDHLDAAHQDAERKARALKRGA